MTRRAGTLLLVAAVALAMGGAAGNGFVYDDVPILVENRRLHDLRELPALLAHPWWPNGLWRPATSLLFAGQWALGGGSPLPFHFVSLLLYAVVVLQVRRLGERVGLAPILALGVALLFAVHPVHVEVVANVVGQAELLCAVGLLGGTLHHLRHRETAWRRRDVAALAGWQLLAAGAKEQGFLLVPLLLALEWAHAPGTGAAWSRRLRPLVPALLAAATLFVLRADVTGSFAGETPAAPLRGLAVTDRVGVFLGAVPTIGRLLLWPARLQADYSPPAIPVTGDEAAAARLGGALLVALTFLGLFACRRRVPLVTLGLGWMAVTLLPITGLLAPPGLLLAERVLFLPGVGMLIAVGGGMAALARRRGAVVHPLAVAVVVLALLGAWRSARRVPVWRSQDAFYAALPREAADAYRAHVVAGNYWAGRGEPARAEALLRRAVTLYDRDPFAWESLGQLLRTEGRCPEAIPFFTRGLALEPYRAPLRARLVACHRRTGDDRTADRVAAEGAAIDLLADPDAP